MPTCSRRARRGLSRGGQSAPLQGARRDDGSSRAADDEPSAAEIVEAIEATPAEVIVLPNNPTAVATAEQAVALASRPARVVPARSIQAGFAAIVGYVPTNTPEQNEAVMLTTSPRSSSPAR